MCNWRTAHKLYRNANGHRDACIECLCEISYDSQGETLLTPPTSQCRPHRILASRQASVDPNRGLCGTDEAFFKAEESLREPAS